MRTAEPLTIEAIRGHLTTDTGRRLHLFAEVDSTNDRLREMARSGEREGAVVVADAQHAGRGRRGQRWFSPPGVNIYASILLRPEITPGELLPFSFIASLALVDALEALGVRATIKWPNDVLVDGKKVAGTLVDSGLRGDAVDYVILGVGLNVNVTGAELRAALGEAGRFSTSLSEALGHEVDRNALLAAWLDRVGAWLLRWKREGVSALQRRWADHDILVGRRVDVRGDGGTFEGRVLGLAETGSLIVQDTAGRRHNVTTEEIRLQP